MAKAMKICIDAGHGGKDSGAVGPKPVELQEKDVNLLIAHKLSVWLKRKGYETVLPRKDDHYWRLSARAEFANRCKADLYVSIHCNAASNASAHGIETFHMEGSTKGKQAARRVQDSLISAFMGHRDRGIKTANFAVLRLTKMPAILVECEFISNPEQQEFLASNTKQERIAEAIAAGIQVYAA